MTNEKYFCKQCKETLITIHTFRRGGLCSKCSHHNYYQRTQKTWI